MILFIVFIIFWVIMGATMLFRMDCEGVNWAGFVFLFMPPFIPLVAAWAGLL